MTTRSAAHQDAARLTDTGSRDGTGAGSLLAVDDVRASLLRLVERFRPDDARGIAGSWVVDVHGHRPYTLHIREGRCLVSPGAPADATARIVTDAATWLGIVDGSTDGIRAFMAGRVQIAGDLNLAVRLQTMFSPGPSSDRILRTAHTQTRGVEVESFVAGSGTPVLLLHGLAANKVSMLPTFDGLADDHEVHALDLPGFGKSAKPLPSGKRYSPAWMAEVVHGYLVRHRLRSVYVVGNSMGGRIATELALRHPRAVRGIVGLGAAVAFDEYQKIGPLLRLTRTQWLGLAPLYLRREWIEQGLSTLLFHDPACLPPDNIRAAADDVLLMARDRGYRLAVAAAARHLGAERAEGRRGYWNKLSRLRVPSLWVWGRSDNLVSWRYSERVKELLPGAEVQVWDGVGHVPQFEAPDRTTAAVRDFVARIEAGR